MNVVNIFIRICFFFPGKLCTNRHGSSKKIPENGKVKDTRTVLKLREKKQLSLKR